MSTLGDACPVIEATCTASEPYTKDDLPAVEDPIGVLQDLKEKKCQLELAKSDGWVNADNQLVKVDSQIETEMLLLRSSGQLKPEMHCEKDFREWSEWSTEGPLEDTPPTQSVALRSARPGLGLALLQVSLLLVGAAAVSHPCAQQLSGRQEVLLSLHS